MLYRPEEFLNRSSGGDSSSVDFKSLKELSFKCVNVTGETIEFFVSNCPLLEKVVVYNSDAILNLKVCFELKSFRVSAPHLLLIKLNNYFLRMFLIHFNVQLYCGVVDLGDFIGKWRR